jgi:hypothetical protein
VPVRQGLVICFLQHLFVGLCRLEVGAHLARTGSFSCVKEHVF